MRQDWVLPCIGMTVGLFAAALFLMQFGDYNGSNLFGLWALWVLACVAAVMVIALIETIKLMKAGETRPTAALLSIFNLRYWLEALGGPVLAGFNLVTFMWVKPEINAVSPFRFDQSLAAIDHAIFGTDPWRLLQWIDLDLMARTYNQFWLLALVVMVFVLFSRPNTRDRSALIIAFFFLWSVFGPVGQFLFPAAGPIFYERIGLGDRFVDLTTSLPQLPLTVSGYLWEHYVAGSIAAGAGISAMPSLHIATAMWIVLCCRKTWAFWPSVAFGLYLFAGSIVLGWHYSMDGIVGAAGAVASYAASKWYLMPRRQEVLA